MKRRVFLKNTASTALVPILLNGLPIRAFGHSIFDSASHPNRILVLIQLSGGNDGLNTLIPLDQYHNLLKVRENIMLPERKTLSLYNSSVTALHPSLPDLRTLYNSKMAAFIQGVGYPDPDLSHFRGVEIKLTGSDTKTKLDTGWLGRYLDPMFPDFPKGYPTHEFPDPPAIKIGTTASKAFQGNSQNMAITIANSFNYTQMLSGENADAPPPTVAGSKIVYVGQTVEVTTLYSKVIKAASDRQSNMVKYPEPLQNGLADQLKIAAQMIGAGLKTRVYMVSMTGYDTHFAQTDSADTTKGTHSELLRDLNEALALFVEDLHRMGKQDDVLCMTFSEFGRRIKSNSSYGTDHGTSEPTMLIGTKLKQGLFGVNPSIPNHITVDDNLEMQHDFRSVYASVLKGWLGVPDQAVKAAVLGNFPIIDLFQS